MAKDKKKNAEEEVIEEKEVVAEPSKEEELQKQLTALRNRLPFAQNFC